MVLKKRNKKIIAGLMAIAIILTTAFLCVGTSLAYYNAYLSQQNTSTINPFTNGLYVYFLQDDGTKIKETNPEMITIELIDTTKPKHLSRLRVDAMFTGSYSAMMRLEVFHFWSKGNTTPSRANIQFKYTSSMFIDSLATNNSFYYCRTSEYASTDVAVGGRNAYILSPNYSGNVLAVITGLNQDIRYETDVRLTLMIVLSVVQENRGEATWGNLPPPPTP